MIGNSFLIFIDLAYQKKIFPPHIMERYLGMLLAVLELRTQ